MLAWFDAAALLLADSDRWREMGAGFRGEHAKLDLHDLWIGLASLAGVIGFFYLLARLVAKQDKRRIYNSPAALFRALCTAHELKRPDRKLLKQIARGYGFEPPARVFVEPRCFEAANLPASLKNQAAAIANLRVRLFGEKTAPAEPDLRQTVDFYAAVQADHQ